MLIKRRNFLLSAAACSIPVNLQTTPTQSGSRRAAVTIGVDKPSGTLPHLRAAATGAFQFGNWLAKEGFDVVCFTDQINSVSAHNISNAIRSIINCGVYSQLVVYFSGHGFYKDSTEFWLLSDAPDDPNEAIVLYECERIAHQTGIPSVVFISDACRSLPSSLNVDRVRGSVIFPNPSTPVDDDTEVDTFYATAPGESAYEVKISSSFYDGIYTSTFLDTFTNPPSDLITRVTDFDVITNRKLKPYLKQEVPRRARLAASGLIQTPAAWLQCGDNAYIGQVKSPGGGGGGPTTTPSDELPPATVADVAAKALESMDAPLGIQPSTSPEALNKVSSESGFSNSIYNILEADKVAITNLARSDARESTPVFSVVGDAIVRSLSYHSSTEFKVDKQIISILDRESFRKPVTMAVQFASGFGTVLACLPNYAGLMTVNEGKVISVTYRPTSDIIGGGYDRTSNDLDTLRAVVATSTQYGVFKIEGTRDERERSAAQIANRIRVMKSIDPTLGLYAAYAYSDAYLIDQVRSVAEYMDMDINGQLFDVAMLSGWLTGHTIDYSRIVPVCPMLSQGWLMLRVNNIQLLGGMKEAQDHLVSSLWTAFNSDGMALVFGALAG